MFPSLYICILLGQFTETPKPPNQDTAVVARGGTEGQFDWSDAEDRVSGTIAPLSAVTDSAIETVVRVGTFQGPEWSGPVTLTLKGPEAGAVDTATVAMNAKSKAWAAKLKTTVEGDYTLEIAFTTTRHKVVRVPFAVADAPLKRWPWWVLVGVFGLGALYFGIRSVVGKKPT